MKISYIAPVVLVSSVEEDDIIRTSTGLDEEGGGDEVVGG